LQQTVELRNARRHSLRSCPARSLIGSTAAERKPLGGIQRPALMPFKKCRKCGNDVRMQDWKCWSCGASGVDAFGQDAVPGSPQQQSQAGPIFGTLLLLILPVGLWMTCRGSDEAGQITSTVHEPSLPSLEPGAQLVPVRSDNATYYLLRQSRMANGNYEVVTRRDGRSGTSYARREVRCRGGRAFRYLGEGDTYEQALKEAPNLGQMSELVAGSISDEVVHFVCTVAGR
jgi:hypothetical protein